MKFAVGDRVRVIFRYSGFYSKIGTITFIDKSSKLWYKVRLDKNQDGDSYSVLFDQYELESIEEFPEVGDTVRVSFEGEVTRAEDRDGGVVLISSENGNSWHKASDAEVISKAVAEPVGLLVGSWVVENGVAPVGTIARVFSTGTDTPYVVFNGSDWVRVSVTAEVITFPALARYKVTYVPPVVESQ